MLVRRYDGGCGVGRKGKGTKGGGGIEINQAVRPSSVELDHQLFVSSSEVDRLPGTSGTGGGGGKGGGAEGWQTLCRISSSSERRPWGPKPIVQTLCIAREEARAN